VWFSAYTEGFQSAPKVYNLTVPTDAKDTGDIPIGHVGRYVRLMPSLSSTAMNISQVVIKDVSGNNLGMKRGVSVTSSDTKSGAAPPSSVVNGKLTINPWANLWHSLDSTDAYLQIDLGSEQYLASIQILGRADCCNRLVGMRIQISEEDPNIVAVMNPGPMDLIGVTFPKNMAKYALSVYGDPMTARMNLMSNYNTLQSQMQTTQYDQGVVNAWSADPLKESCKQLDTIRSNFMAQLATAKKSIKDLSGTVQLAGDIHDQNMGYQARLTNVCKGNLTADCMSLATQDAPMFSLLASYNTAEKDVYSNEYDISNNLQTITDAYRVLGCDVPADMVLPKDTSIGMIDTTDLTSKLQNFSPYYISPDIMKYIVGSIAPANKVEDKLQYSSDQMVIINQVVNNIKTLTNTT